MCGYTCICVCTHGFICISIYMYPAKSGYSYIYLYIYVYICIYIYVRILVYLYIHTYIHTYIHSEIWGFLFQASLSSGFGFRVWGCEFWISGMYVVRYSGGRERGVCSRRSRRCVVLLQNQSRLNRCVGMHQNAAPVQVLT